MIIYKLKKENCEIRKKYYYFLYKKKSKFKKESLDYIG